MLKTTRSLAEPTPSRNDGSKSVSRKNNNSKPAFGRNNNNNEDNRFGGNNVEQIMSRNSKGQKSVKSWKLSKSRNSKRKKSVNFKKLSKSENLPIFNDKKAGLIFPNPKAKAAFNRLRLAFTESPILWYYDLEYHNQTEINALGYAISGILNQLAFKTRPDEYSLRLVWASSIW